MMNIIRHLSKSSSNDDPRRRESFGSQDSDSKNSPVDVSPRSPHSPTFEPDVSSLSGSTQVDLDTANDPASFLPSNLVPYTVLSQSSLTSSRTILRDGNEVFFIEYNKFHPTRSPIELHSLPDKRLLGEARYKPYAIAGLRAEVHVDSRHHSKRTYEDVGFDATSSEGWTWSRSAPDGLESVWKVGDLKFTDARGNIVAVLCKARSRKKAKKLEERIFVTPAVAEGAGGGSVLEFIVLSCFAVEEAWKRTRRNVTGTVANAGAFGGAVGFAGGPNLVT